MTARLFFALPVSEDSREAIAHWREPFIEQFPATWVPAENFHVTVAFIGDTPRDTIDSVIDFADSKIDTGLFPFQWDINHVSHFRSGVLYLTGYNTPFEMTHLVKALDFFVPLHSKPKSFIPHITVARHATHVSLPNLELNLRFDQLVLFESNTQNGSVFYQPLKVWANQS